MSKEKRRKNVAVTIKFKKNDHEINIHTWLLTHNQNESFRYIPL